ncbi:MAG: hypothetical protein R3E67_04765 [Pseudomonadales bacterium]
MSQALYDEEGFLLELTAWKPELATHIAEQCDDCTHRCVLEVIHHLRNFLTSNLASHPPCVHCVNI